MVHQIIFLDAIRHLHGIQLRDDENQLKTDGIMRDMFPWFNACFVGVRCRYSHYCHSWLVIISHPPPQKKIVNQPSQILKQKLNQKHQLVVVQPLLLLIIPLSSTNIISSCLLSPIIRYYVWTIMNGYNPVFLCSLILAVSLLDPRRSEAVRLTPDPAAGWLYPSRTSLLVGEWCFTRISWWISYDLILLNGCSMRSTMQWNDDGE